MSTVTDHDVVVVGYGPVGQAVARLLGLRGWSVLALDRQPGLYPLPRACHLDHEAMRILQAMGIADRIDAAMVPAREYLLLRGDLSVLSDLPRGWETPSGWESSYHFFQPDIEGIFDDAARSTPGVTVRQSTAVSAVVEKGDHVEITVEGEDRPLTARYVIGADGANSLVRQQAGIGQEDLGFEATWVVVDVEMKHGCTHPKVPDTGQVLDPRQPSHMAWLGGGHYRWEFMIVDGRDPAEAARPEQIWPKLERWITPDTAVLLRSTAYTFRSLLASTFRHGRMLLAGDAAHLMPPFMGQGMVSGLRDASTLCWMMDLVLRDVAPASFLDGYTDARRPHVEAYIRESVRVGQLVCETDAAKAAERDRILEAQTQSSPPFQPRLGAGFAEGPLGGRLAVQPRIAGQGRLRADDVLGTSFALLSTDPSDLEALSASARAALARLGAVAAAVVGSSDEAPLCSDPVLVEEGARLRRWLDTAGATWVLVRPDGYVYASGAGGAEAESAVSGLVGFVTGQEREALQAAGRTGAA